MTVSDDIADIQVKAITSPCAFTGPPKSHRFNQRRAAKGTDPVEPRHSKMGLCHSRAPPEWAGKEHLRRNRIHSNHPRAVAIFRRSACSHRKTGKRSSALFPSSARHIADRSMLFGAGSCACRFQIPDGDHDHDSQPRIEKPFCRHSVCRHQQGRSQHEQGSDNSENHSHPTPAPKSTNNVGGQTDEGEQQQNIAD